MNENEMNLLENQLRSWQPRQPSPKLKARLFNSTVQRNTLAFSLRWLAPAAACLLLALTIANQESGLSPRSTRHEPALGLLSSNLSYTNISHPTDHNRVLPVSFEWTNRSGFTSNVSPFSPGRMN